MAQNNKDFGTWFCFAREPASVACDNEQGILLFRGPAWVSTLATPSARKKWRGYLEEMNEQRRKNSKRKKERKKKKKEIPTVGEACMAIF